MDLSSITLPPLFIITDKLLQLQTSLLLFLSHPTSVDSPASNDGQRNHTAYVRQNLPPLYDALRESRPIQNLYSPFINALTTCMVEAGSTLSSSSPTTNIKRTTQQMCIFHIRPFLILISYRIAQPKFIPPNLIHTVIMTTTSRISRFIEIRIKQNCICRFLTTGRTTVNTYLSTSI